MVQVLSKLQGIPVACHATIHPWTDSCLDATMGLYMHSVIYSLKFYASLYLFVLLIRGRIPKKKDIKKTIGAVIRSATYLSAAVTGCISNICILRKVLGHFNIVTTVFLPGFIAAALTIFIESPSRRTLLCLYASNLATETVWNMLASRNMVVPIRYGNVAIFALSMSALLTLFRSGLHAREEKMMDPTFKVLRFVIGRHEEKNPHHTENFRPYTETENDHSVKLSSKQENKNIVLVLVNNALRYYKQLINKIKYYNRHTVCPHPFSCFYYTLEGTTKMFTVGLGIQLGLKLAMNVQTLFKDPKKFGNIVFRRDTINLPLFLSGFSGIFRAVSCLLRRTTGKDSPLFAFPAGLLAGVAFCQYPNNNIAIYALWKTLHIMYNVGIEMGYVREVPGFKLILYSFSVAVNLHAASLEPHNVRAGYWKVLCDATSGGLACFDRAPFEPWGLGTVRGLAQTLKHTKTPHEMQWRGRTWKPKQTLI